MEIEVDCRHYNILYTDYKNTRTLEKSLLKNYE